MSFRSPADWFYCQGSWHREKYPKNEFHRLARVYTDAVSHSVARAGGTEEKQERAISKMINEFPVMWCEMEERHRDALYSSVIMALQCSESWPAWYGHIRSLFSIEQLE